MQKRRHSFFSKFIPKNIQNFLPVLLWTIVLGIVAYKRSFWGDEYARFTQAEAGLKKAFHDLFLEPSPFAPGETILEWFSKILFSWIFPGEVWARIPGIFWGALSLALALSISRLDRVFKYLPWFVGFSAALANLATEARPYASLYFSGALAFYILWLPQRNWPRWLFHIVWFSLALGHIYGICFVGFACFLRRRFVPALVSILYVAWILAQYKLHLSGSTPYPRLTDLLRQTLGTLGNPHKASLLLVPLFGLGTYFLFRRNKKFTGETYLLLAVTVLGPIYATLRSRYFFSPRQVAGGSFFFLAVCSAGLAGFEDFLQRKNRKLSALTAYFLIFLAGALPWVRITLLKIPPFPNQPMHQFREIVENISSPSNILSLDPCNEGPLSYYFEKKFGSPIDIQHVIMDGITLKKQCWKNQICFYSMLDFLYCSAGADLFIAGARAGQLVRNPKWNTLIYGWEEGFPEDFFTSAAPIRAQAIRSW